MDTEWTNDGQRDMDRYKDLIIQLRRACLCFQKQCVSPIGEVTSLLMIQQMSGGGGQVTVSDLGDQLQLSRPAASRMIHNLEKKGLVAFCPGGKDHRYHYLVLTEAGTERIRQDMDRYMDLIRAIREKMGEEDMDRFIHYSTRFFSLLAQEKESVKKMT